MFGSEILDVAIGLVLTFLLVSLIVTSVQEAIEAILKTRAKDLRIALGEIFQGRSELLDRFYAHPLISAYYRGDAEHARTDGPSYLPRETFSAALADLVETQSDLAESGVGDAYRALERTVNFDPALLRRELEGWFDGAMDRASGRFKRRTQKRIFAIALAGSLLLNINAVTIGQHLAVSGPAREQAARVAEATIKAGVPSGDEEVSLYRRTLERSSLPIGWCDMGGENCRAYRLDLSRDGLFYFVLLAAGFLITAFAAMLGAPFWFDTLNRLMVIRATVKPREKSPDEPSNDGGGGGSPRAAGGGGGGAGPTASGASAATAAGATADPLGPDDGLDGCLSGHELGADELIDDVELPPARGGVATTAQGS